MSKRLYVTGGWGYGNKGDNAILAAMLETFRHELPDVQFHLTSYSPEEIEQMHGLHAVQSLHKLLTRRNPMSYARRLALSFWRWTRNAFGEGIMLSSDLQQHLDKMKEANAVVMGGGGYFNDAWKDALPARLLEIEFATAVGTPLMIYGQTVGPFTEKTSSTILRRALRGVAYVAYRDAQSKHVLERAHCNVDSMELTADEANLIPFISTDIDRKRFCEDPENALVGVMIQNLRRHEAPTGSSVKGKITTDETYYKEVCDALSSIAENGHVSFVIVPSTKWDQKSCGRVAAELTARGVKNLLFLNDPDVDTFVRACQSVDVMISTNMHPIIIATTAGKPSIAISYHYKLDDYMTSIGMSENVARIDNFDAGWIVERYNDSVSNKAARKKNILEQHEYVKGKARRNGVILRKLIGV